MLDCENSTNNLLKIVLVEVLESLSVRETSENKIDRRESAKLALKALETTKESELVSKRLRKRVISERLNSAKNK